MVTCFALMCTCTKPDFLLVTVHTEEGEDEEDLDDNDEQDGKDEDNEDNEMSQVPPPCWSPLS